MAAIKRTDNNDWLVGSSDINLISDEIGADDPGQRQGDDAVFAGAGSGPPAGQAGNDTHRGDNRVHAHWQHRARSALAGILLSTAAVLAPAYAADRPGEAEDPFNRIHSALLRGGKAVERSATELPAAAMAKAASVMATKADTAPLLRPAEKVHPLLARRIAGREASTSELVVVTFREDVQIPRFPEPALTERRESAANTAARRRAGEIVAAVEARRAPNYSRRAAKLRQQHGAQMMQTFWLANAALVRMPLGAIADLARDPDVLYIEPQQAQDRPPDANPDNDVADGRARIASDPYFNLNLSGGFIGLLDTGVRWTHVLFNNPSHIFFFEDCTNGTCNGFPNPADDCWIHGTSSAAIISGNNRLLSAYRGVTAITLDSFKVYPSGCGGLDTSAVLAAFQRAVAVLDRVIVAEMQGSGSDQSSISIAADNAFNAGAVIIAANGNNGPAGSTVNAPANAHKVIGVGAYNVQTLAQYNGQSRGPAPDGRFKPDIQAPTDTETASGVSDTELRVFSGTSGATPYAAGAAALARNFLRGTSTSIDPGQVYAYLILSGQKPHPFDNTSGAGGLVLPTNGQVWWGKVSVGNHKTIDIPLSLAAGSNTLDGALWWPESATQAHNDIDLSLIAPSGAAVASSATLTSVFELARVAGAVAAGTWKLRIRGYSVPTGSQTVYWAAYVRR
jgi:serine protease AprX